MQKYNNIIDYINNHQNISEDLRKELMNLIKKFKVLISCMKEKDLYNLINLSIDARSTETLKKELNNIAYGKGWKKAKNKVKDEMYKC